MYQFENIAVNDAKQKSYGDWNIHTAKQAAKRYAKNKVAKQTRKA